MLINHLHKAQDLLRSQIWGHAAADRDQWASIDTFIWIESYNVVMCLQAFNLLTHLSTYSLATSIFNLSSITYNITYATPLQTKVELNSQ